MQKVRSKYLVITSDYVLPGIIILCVLLLVWLTFFSRFFSVTKITCFIDYEPCENSALETEINKFRGVNIFRFDEEILKNRILSGEFTIRSLDIKRTLPGTVTLSLQSVIPLLAVHAKGDPRYITLDKEFRVIKVTSQKPNLLIVEVPTLPPIQVGKLIEDKLTPLFSLAAKLNQKLNGIQEVFKQDDNSVIIVVNNYRVVMSSQIDIDKQIRLLQAVLTDSTILKGKQEIDVRFSQPVLR